MDFTPPLFANAPIGSDQESDCSPKITDPRFRGVAIRAPQRVVAKPGETARLPVCGKYRLPTGPLVAGAIMYVHVRSTDNAIPEPISAPVVGGVDASRPPARKRPDPALFANQVSTSFFNVDALHYLPTKLPPGHYEMRISYGDVMSNVEAFEIVRR